MATTTNYNVTFINRRLSDKEKSAFPKWSEAASPDLFSFLEQLVGSGHKISLSFSHKSDCATASITCQDAGSVNAKRCVTSRHGTIGDALMVALYKHFELLFDTDWAENMETVDWG